MFREKIGKPKFFSRNKGTHFKEIAKQRGMNDEEANKFSRFMKIRFPHERDKGYISEWVERIKTGNPYAYADSETQKALKKAGY